MRIEWVHPSWRDLVIERLASDSTARRHFLSASGAHGLVLALPTAGGSFGERSLPLVGSDQDWDAVTDRLYALIAELELPELEAMFAALSEAIFQLGDRHGRDEACAAAGTALTRTAALWDASRKPIALDALHAWISLARNLAPRPEVPDLSVTWVELLPARAPQLDGRADVERFADWLGLCELLWGYDPDLRERLGFGVEQVHVMVVFLTRVERARSSEVAGLPKSSSDAVFRALSSIGSLAPELSGYAQFIRARLDDEVEFGSAQLPPPSRPFYRGETFDVRRVLLDL